MERKQATTTSFLLALSAIALYFCYVIGRPGPVVLSVTLVVLEMLRETNLGYTAAR